MFVCALPAQNLTRFQNTFFIQYYKSNVTQLQGRYKLIIVWLPVNYWKAWSECCDDELMAVPVVRPGRARGHVTM